MRGLRIGHGVGPRLGAHGSDFDLQGSGASPQTVTLSTKASGSSILVASFGNPNLSGAPSDNKGNSFSLLQSNGYFGGQWDPFNLELYGCANAAGGSSHAVSVAKPSSPTEESTILVVEVEAGATIQASSIVARAGAGAGVAYSSASVTTTGPALLVSVWGGDGGVDTADQTATPEAGWDRIEGYFLGLTAYIQAAMAVKRVSGAGTHTCAWTPTANQGAIIALVAVQA